MNNIDNCGPAYNKQQIPGKTLQENNNIVASWFYWYVQQQRKTFYQINDTNFY